MSQGCSVVDYCLVSDSFVDRTAKFIVCDRVESPHMPMLFEIAYAQGRKAPTVTQSLSRLVWPRDNIRDFMEPFEGEGFRDKMALATEEIERCINNALNKFTDCPMNASACLRKRQTDDIRGKDVAFGLIENATRKRNC